MNGYTSGFDRFHFEDFVFESEIILLQTDFNKKIRFLFKANAVVLKRCPKAVFISFSKPLRSVKRYLEAV